MLAQTKRKEEKRNPQKHKKPRARISIGLTAMLTGGVGDDENNSILRGKNVCQHFI